MYGVCQRIKKAKNKCKMLASQIENANQINSVQQSSSIIDKLKFRTVISYIKKDFI